MENIENKVNLFRWWIPSSVEMTMLKNSNEVKNDWNSNQGAFEGWVKVDALLTVWKDIKTWLDQEKRNKEVFDLGLKMGDWCFVATSLVLQDDIGIPRQEKLDILLNPKVFSRIIFA